MTATEQRVMTLQLKVIFRPARRDDLPKLEWHGEYTHFRRVFARAYEEQMQGKRLMLLADVNNFPIGQVFVQLANTEDIFSFANRRAYLYSLRVMDAFRGQGIGTALLQEAERILSEHGYTSMSIAAAKDNPSARRLYERLGFEVTTEDSGHWNYVDHEGRTRHVVEPCWILEKQLRGNPPPPAQRKRGR
ncbi:MAG: GNAT family N-acetyltransferase [Anaerolineae bacterium]|nr:GNAT family N-acetyltransferase [Anaerolineae bacterium]